MAQQPSVRWRPAPCAALAWREWDDVLVIRNGNSGSTHLLNALARTVMLELVRSDHALRAAELAAKLSGFIDEHDLRATTETILANSSASD